MQKELRKDVETLKAANLKLSGGRGTSLALTASTFHTSENFEKQSYFLDFFREINQMMYNSWHRKALFFFKFCVLGYKTILAVYSAQGWEFAHSFIFGERTERFAHIAHQK